MEPPRHIYASRADRRTGRRWSRRAGDRRTGRRWSRSRRRHPFRTASWMLAAAAALVLAGELVRVAG